MSSCCRRKKKDSYCDPCPQSSECLKDVCDGGLAPRPSCVDEMKKSKDFKPPHEDKNKTERDYERLQQEFYTVQMLLDKVQFRLRQILQARPGERDILLGELASIAFGNVGEFSLCDNLPNMEKDFICLGNVAVRRKCLVKKLRAQMKILNKYTVPREAEKEEGTKKKKKFLCF